MSLPDLTGKLSAYVAEFNAADTELYAQSVPNAAAFEYLKNNAPLLDCPDPVLERAYYFRWWTLRKHWKKTPFGYILTEFLPQVGWSGPQNSIVCALGHHLREARWLRDDEGRLWDYVRFWLNGHGDAFAYSAWFASAVEACLELRPSELTDLFLVDHRQDTAVRTEDGRDGMECSVSGSGLRPTLNSYMCADAFAIARMAQKTGERAMAAEYLERGERIKEAMEALLWDGDFYRVIPCAETAPAGWSVRPAVPEKHRVRELLGYIPWYFGLAPPSHDFALRALTEENGFRAPYGLTTAERSHPRFLFRHPHECLWNGYVWPFATAQTLTAVANVLHTRGENAPLINEDYYAMLRQYAAAHTLTKDTGETVMWIDEVMHPFTGRWSARDQLKKTGRETIGGVIERGKDYNHSTFCDLVLSGLLGIRRNENGELTAEPVLPASWDHFLVTGLTRENVSVLYDKTGNYYGCGAGLQIFRAEESTERRETDGS